MNADWLEQKGMVKAILYFFENPGSIKSNLRKEEFVGLDSKNAQTVHAMLWEGGYLEVVPHPRKLLFKLSPKGEFIARHLQAIVNESCGEE